MATERALTARDERRLARSFTHQQRPWWSCWRMSRQFCIRCIWRDLTGANKRAKRRHVALMHERAKSIPPSARRYYEQQPDGSWKRISLPAMLAPEDVMRRFKDGDEHGWDVEFAWLDEHHANELSALREAVIEKGYIHTPIHVGVDGRVWDGHHRLRVAVELGLALVPVQIDMPKVTDA